MWRYRRLLPKGGEVWVVRQDQLVQDDMFDDGVEEQVAETHQTAQDGAEQQTWKKKEKDSSIIKIKITLLPIFRERWGG